MATTERRKPATFNSRTSGLNVWLSQRRSPHMLTTYAQKKRRPNGIMHWCRRQYFPGSCVYLFLSPGNVQDHLSLTSLKAEKIKRFELIRSPYCAIASAFVPVLRRQNFNKAFSVLCEKAPRYENSSYPSNCGRLR